MALFNVRVYGLLVNAQNQLLISDEQEYGMRFTKFPGGGLELGEGLINGLKREFMEECNVDIEILDHFYTTDFYFKSVFNEAEVICVYYRVQNIDELKLDFKTKVFDFDNTTEVLQTFRWFDLATIKPEDMTFQIDQHVIKLLIDNK